MEEVVSGKVYGDRLSPEERAVIEAAERVIDWWGKPCISSEGNALSEAVLALRESRKPKPRWGVSQNVSGIAHWLTFDGIDAGVWSHKRETMEMISEALNRASERGEP